MEEGVNNKNYDDNEKMMRKKRKTKQTYSYSTQTVKCKIVIDERFGKDVNLDEEA